MTLRILWCPLSTQSVRFKPKVDGAMVDLSNDLVKLARDLTRPIYPPNGGHCKGNPLFQGKTRLVKYYSIWGQNDGAIFFWGI